MCIKAGLPLGCSRLKLKWTQGIRYAYASYGISPSRIDGCRGGCSPQAEHPCCASSERETRRRAIQRSPSCSSFHAGTRSRPSPVHIEDGYGERSEWVLALES